MEVKEKPIHIYIIEGDDFIEGEKWGNYVKINEGAGIYKNIYLMGHVQWSIDNGYDVEVVHDKFENYND